MKIIFLSLGVIFAVWFTWTWFKHIDDPIDTLAEDNDDFLKPYYEE
jgi:hypothetical protein